MATEKAPSSRKQPLKKSEPRAKGRGKPSIRMPGPNDLVEFHFIKGPDFRTLHVDGFLGGVTPRGFLHMAAYSERSAIPRKVPHRINENGTLGERVDEKEESLSGYVRQMEVDLFLNEQAVRELHSWLAEKLEEFEQLRKVRERLEGTASAEANDGERK